ncbi:hypothetical protein SCHPADRAFT_906793 [Schizopora paradoxa]|uniref:Elongin-A n=1 Tax=Schizopora paradoxa TaxID=27342 RepID=A0A0H2S0L6_9AGAM|nr:hypothetical protein SCHPADRAFT_906793 [Schizopora paradoxa]
MAQSSRSCCTLYSPNLARFPMHIAARFNIICDAKFLQKCLRQLPNPATQATAVQVSELLVHDDDDDHKYSRNRPLAAMSEGAGSSHSPSKVPNLVHLCQRVLAANIDAISSFGEDIPHRLVRPVLQGCSADTLLRLELETPDLMDGNEELWRGLCIRAYPAVADATGSSESEEPVSWRSEYLHLRDEENRRFEEAANRIRNQRLEAEELKRKRQIKITDRLPPPKRVRHGWSNGPAPPKTLFEKTRAEASKFQKNVFNSRAAQPPSSSIKSTRPKLGSSNVPLFPPCRSAPVAVTTVTVRTSNRPSHSPPQSISKPEVSASPLSQKESRPPTRFPPESSPPPPRNAARAKNKDPMASLFVPKHKAHSQLSTSAHHLQKVSSG